MGDEVWVTHYTLHIHISLSQITIFLEFYSETLSSALYMSGSTNKNVRIFKPSIKAECQADLEIVKSVFVSLSY